MTLRSLDNNDTNITNPLTSSSSVQLSKVVYQKSIIEHVIFTTTAKKTTDR